MGSLETSEKEASMRSTAILAMLAPASRECLTAMNESV
jgi:hypothetical protein